MQAFRVDAGLVATALYDPDAAAAARLTAELRNAGLVVERRGDADEFVEVVRVGDFRTLVVAADLENPACLRFLQRLRRASPASWLVVSNAILDARALHVARRHGVDVPLGAPLETLELVWRLRALQVHSRPPE